MKVAILHYSLPPVVGGVESVILEHTRLLLDAGYQVKLIAGVGETSALPAGAELVLIPEMSSRHPAILPASQQLEAGKVPGNFEALAANLGKSLQDALEGIDCVIVHNVFSKHFNLPLTAALAHLLDQAKMKRCIAWNHDFTWTSTHSRSRVHQGYPWDLLRTYRPDLSYVTVSKYRQAELARLLACPPQKIQVIYNGVDPNELFSLSGQGQALAKRLNLEGADIILLMPVRITQAKNIELAMRVIACLKEKEIQPRLVITGPPDPHDPADIEYYQTLKVLRRALGIEQEARFVYESGPFRGKGYTIDLSLVMELYRMCDALLMPSHREGFGMPILEAGLLGMPIFGTDIPAVDEIGCEEVIGFEHDATPEEVADLILLWLQASPTQRLRQRVRQKYTWQAIFRQDIVPLLAGGVAR